MGHNAATITAAVIINIMIIIRNIIVVIYKGLYNSAIFLKVNWARFSLVLFAITAPK